MLVLSRKIGRRILIGKDIVVTVLDIRGNQVRLGIDAPRDVVVLREELEPYLGMSGLVNKESVHRKAA